MKKSSTKRINKGRNSKAGVAAKIAAREAKREEKWKKKVMKDTGIETWENGRYKIEVIPDMSSMPEVKYTRGRPTKYHPKYCKMMVNYFKRPYFRIKRMVDNENKETFHTEKEVSYLPLFEGFANKIGVVSNTLRGWTVEHPEFLVAYQECRDFQKQMLADLSNAGHYNTYFSKFMAINLTDWEEKSKQEVTGPEGTPLFDVTKLTPEQLTTFKTLLDSAKQNEPQAK